MVKQTKTFKKGNVTKKALSAILAASMVMTSSSFVMAAPVEVEDVAVEAAAVDEVAEVTEEQVGTATELTFKDASIDFAKKDFNYDGTPISEGGIYDGNLKTANEIWDCFIGTNIAVKNGNTETTMKLSKAIESGLYTVTRTNTDTGETDTIPTTNGRKIVWKVGNYTITLAGKQEAGTIALGTGDTSTSNIFATGKIAGTISIKHNPAHLANVVLKDTAPQTTKTYIYTGQAIEPKVTITLDGETLEEGRDYSLAYEKNTDICKANEKIATIKITYMNRFGARGTEKEYFGIAQIALSETNTKVTLSETPKYNGKPQLPTVKVELKGSDGTYTELTKDKDYTVAVTPIAPNTDTTVTNAGKYKVVVTGINNCKENVTLDGTKAYEIKAQDFSKVTVSVPDVLLSKASAGARPVVTDENGNVLKVGSDYTILYEQEDRSFTSTVPTTKGQHCIKIKSTGKNYTEGEVRTVYNVVDRIDTLADYVAGGVNFEGAVNGNEYAYDPADGIVPSVTVGGLTYAPDGKVTGTVADAVKASRFDVVFPTKDECKNVGTYTIKFVGKAGTPWADQTAEVSYKIVPETLNDSMIVETAKLNKTTSGELAATLLLKDGTYRLVKGTDYDYVIQKKTLGSGYNVVVTGKGNYTGTLSAYVASITEGVDLSSDAITAEVTGSFVYDGIRKMPTLDQIVLKENGVTLRPGIDYVLYTTSSDPKAAYGENVKVGEGSVKVVAKPTADAYYTGERTVYFNITATETEKDNYVLDTAKLKEVYEQGTSFKPEDDIVVKTSKGTILAKTDYEVAYIRDGKVVDPTLAYGTAAKAGAVTMEITIKATKTKLAAVYRIATELGKAAIIPSKLDDQKFTGSAITPEIKIVKKNTVVELVKGQDYVVTYSNNINHGTAYATIEGIGDYYGTYTVPFKIAGQAEQSIEVLAAQARDIQSRTLNSKPTVVKFEAGKAPKTDVTYASSNEDVVKVDETGKITYTGLGEATITIKAAETAEYKAAETTMTVKVGLAKPSFTPFSKNNAFTLTSSTVKGAEKFEVQYATKKDFSNKKSKTFTATSGKVRQVKVSAGDKTTYYVRVRAISGTTKSAWSTVKTVATK